MSEPNSPGPMTIIRVLSPPLNLHPPNSPPDLYSSAIAHFTSIPWCASRLTAPDAIPFIPQCRNPASDQHDQFFGRTLATDRALAHMLCFFCTDDASHLRDPERPIRRVSTFFALGEGLSGYPSMMHGGMIMAMMDEAMGVTAEINMALGKNVGGGTHVTASLETKFLKMIPTEGVVCATAEIEEFEGRKKRVNCELKDSEGTVLAKCSSLWLALRAKV